MLNPTQSLPASLQPSSVILHGTEGEVVLTVFKRGPPTKSSCWPENMSFFDRLFSYRLFSYPTRTANKRTG